MGIRDDCRHYIHRSTATGEAMQRCRVTANTESPFGCPDGCLFFEPRQVSGAGWSQPPSQPMSNTADALYGLAPEPKRRRGRKKR